MSTPNRLVIDRLELSLQGLGADDARLLASELEGALAVALQQSPPLARQTRGNSGSPQGPLCTALTGPALVSAVAARLADLIGAQAQAQAEPQTEESPSWP